ncbi:MAG: hypothetical protein KBT03_02870 [Bacteroidales bacterium]|nr:hypothetical protein [Candidatus Scybalousia scybalohippi]
MVDKRITNDELEKYFNKQCICGNYDYKTCKNEECSLFLKNRNECVFLSDEKLEAWQKKQHEKLAKELAMYG